MADAKAIAVVMPTEVQPFDLRLGAPMPVQPFAEGIDAATATPADLLGLPEIRVQFPKAADGRAYSLALRLREQGYAGRLIAVGDVHAEMSYFLRRSGFDVVELDARKAPAELPIEQRFPFHAAYQTTAADQDA